MKNKECRYCGYEWQPNVENPKSCPKCHHYLETVKKEVKKAKCKCCGYSWVIRKKIKDIKMCPSCKSRKWNLKD